MQQHIVPWYFWLVVDIVVAVAALSVSWYGGVRGGRVQRIAAGAYGAVWIVNVLYLCLLALPIVPKFDLPWQLAWFWDMALAVVFLYLAIRHHDRWMAAAAIAQGVQMGVHAVNLIVGEFMTRFDLATGLFVSAMSFVMMGCILGSTISHRRALARGTQRSAAELPRPPLFRHRLRRPDLARAR